MFRIWTFKVLSCFILLTLTFSVLEITPAHAAGILYVTPSGISDCSSWENACTLQTALTSAIVSDEIWVAAGTYTPTTGTDRTATFQLKDGVAIYGGFAGTETMRGQRNLAIITILSGDIGIAGINGDNSYHIVTGANNSTLDGFNIIAGNANGISCPGTGCGGGMFNDASSPMLTNVKFINNSAGNGGGMYNTFSSNPILTNVTFSGNSAITDNGGGMYNFSNSSPTLTNVIFSGNSAAGYGGGMHNDSTSSPTLMNVTFSENLAQFGAGMFNGVSSPTLMNVTFTNNSAAFGGGMFNVSNSNPTLTNVTFSGNSAMGFSGNSAEGYGGGMYNWGGSPTLTNVTFSGNTAGAYGGGMHNESSSPQIRNTTFWGNNSSSGAQINNKTSSSILNDSVIQGGCPAGTTCTNIITADPKLGTLGDYGGFTPTIPLLPGSSAINAGNDTVCAAAVGAPDYGAGGLDQRGVARPQGSHCDIGSFEYRYPIFVDVPLDYSVNSYIERLYNAGITGGCSLVPLMYCPENTVTRAQMAVFLLRGIHGSGYTPPAVGAGTGFADVPTNHPVAAWIKQLAAEGITGGCSGGNYCPDATVTRAQMAVFLLRSKYTSAYTPPPANGDFTDVPLDHLMVAWIEQLAAEGITGGCGAGVYCPDGNVTRAQMAVFLVRTFNLP